MLSVYTCYHFLHTTTTTCAQGRNGYGSIYVWAAGNGGGNDDSCAADGYVQSIYTIAIGSVGTDAEPAFYDERCSAKLASTFVTNPFTSIRVVRLIIAQQKHSFR